MAPIGLLARQERYVNGWSQIVQNPAVRSIVALSACNTSKAQLTNGDDLSNAFLYAGARSVVTTLWRNDDAASGELMVAFYRHVRAGLTNAEALRAAQLDVLAQDKWNSPYHWAAFSLTGDYRGR